MIFEVPTFGTQPNCTFFSKVVRAEIETL